MLTWFLNHMAALVGDLAGFLVLLCQAGLPSHPSCPSVTGAWTPGMGAHGLVAGIFSRPFFFLLLVSATGAWTPGMGTHGLVAGISSHRSATWFRGLLAAWLPAGALAHPNYPTSIIIGTSPLLLCKFVLTDMRTPPLTREKQGGFYQNKVNPSLTFIQRPGI